jgi:hypothetical protein
MRLILIFWAEAYIVKKHKEALVDAGKETGKKAIPLQTLTDPEGYRRLRLPDFKTIGT